MLIGSEITYDDAFFILYEVRVIGNHADGDKVLLKKSCHEITPAAAKARFAQVLRNSPRAMPLPGYELARPEPEITYKESALLCSTPRGFPFNFR